MLEDGAPPTLTSLRLSLGCSLVGTTLLTEELKSLVTLMLTIAPFIERVVTDSFSTIPRFFCDKSENDVKDRVCHANLR